jgi:hypothetical protein
MKIRNRNPNRHLTRVVFGVRLRLRLQVSSEEDDMNTPYEMEFDEHEADAQEFAEEWEVYGEADTEAPFDEVEEMELAAGLLEVTDEAELDQFLGNLIRRAGRAVGRVVKSPVGQALGGILKGAAKQALPIAGRAIGTYFGGPAGGALGGQVAQKASQLFGLELEGMSAEDQEFEVARRFVRFAGSAASNAATSSSRDPRSAATSAAMTAARRHAPGLLRGRKPYPSGGGVLGRAGRWIRRGRNIIIVNC